jgi:hypothetical protein
MFYRAVRKAPLPDFKDEVVSISYLKRVLPLFILLLSSDRTPSSIFYLIPDGVFSAAEALAL